MPKLRIDHVLAQHPKTLWGFTAEELDDLINYDIKYRMGRDRKS
ncbi:MAG: hypothetical protein ACRC8A_20705 [Microcoleaceae cyanobacterium]